MIWFILFIILMIVGCITVYKSAEAHELHKMRAAFEDKKVNINKFMKEHNNDPDFNMEYYYGEIEELDELEALIDEELQLLKYFDLENK